MTQGNEGGQETASAVSTGLPDSGLQSRHEQTVPAELAAIAQPRRPIVTSVLIAICVALFLLMVLFKVPPLYPTSAQLLPWGADFGPLTLGGQPWRLLTSVFLHIGILHLALNMWCLWNLGALAEALWGRATFLTTYLLTGVAGAIVSIWWHPFVIGAGASGAIFGIAGALIVFFRLGKVPFPARLAKSTMSSLLAFAGYNLLFGFLSPGIDNAAHVGGLVAGIFLGLALARRHRRPALTAAVLILIAAGTLMARSVGYVVHLERGRTALLSGHLDQAIAELTTTVRRQPKLSEAYFLLGRAQMEKSQFPQAEAAFRQALLLQPGRSEVAYQLGLAVALQGRTFDALSMFQDQVKRQPGSALPLIGIGVTAALQGNQALAMGAFRRAVQLDPLNPEANCKLGMAASQLNLYPEAAAALLQCVRLDPGNFTAFTKLADTYKAMGRYAEAETMYERALKLSPKK